MTRLRLAALALAVVAGPTAAQPFTTLQQDAPAAVPDLSSLAAGGAVTALPTLDSPFVSNPAHVATTVGVRVNVLGVTASAGGNVHESYEFYNEQLGPAIEEGLEQIRRDDPERLETLYREALALGRQQKTAAVAVLAPSVRARAGAVAFGGGLYGHTVSRAKVLDGGAGVPYVDLYGQADVFVPAVLGVDLDRTALGRALPFRLALGASATYVQRRLSAKGETVDAIDPDGEKVYLLRGEAVQLRAGAYARDVAVPGLDFGAEAMTPGAAMTYRLERSWEVSGSGGAPDDAAEVEALRARFEGRASSPVVRVGAAYRLPEALVPGLSRVAVTADYTSASTSEFDQSLQAGLRGGVQARFARLVEVRAGMSQGMPSAGLAIGDRYVRVEYATYGVEDGRLLGQLPRRNHVVQLRLGRF